MNKLASLTLVVVLTSLANAATVSLELDGGGTTVTAGDTVTINITADWDVTDNAGFNLKQSTTSAAGNATAVAVGTLNAGFDLTAFEGNLINTQSGTRFILIDRISGVIDSGSPAIAAGDPLYSFNLLIPAGAVLNDAFTIDDAFGLPVESAGPPEYSTGIHGGGDVSDIGSLTLTVVPEPTTIALLGFGCLFLVRRR